MRVAGNYYVYIMASPSRTVYVRVTNDLVKRVSEHREKLFPGFSARYNCVSLVYYEWHSDIVAAIAREKELKAWRRSKKVELVQNVNPRWRDLWADITAGFHAGQ